MNQAVSIAKKFVNLLTQTGTPVIQTYLFGSFASGTPHQYSDIDICVVSPKLGIDKIDEMVKLNSIASQIDDRIEVIPFGPQDYSNPYDPLAAEIRRHGIPLIS